MVVLPRIPAPASRMRAAGGASSACAGASSFARVPIGAGSPRVAMFSLSVSGTPSSGPSASPARCRASAARACASAASRCTRYMALMRGSQVSMRSRSARVTSTGESSRREYPLASCAAVRFETPAIAGLYTRRRPMLRAFFAIFLLCAAGLAYPAAIEIRLWHGMSGAPAAELDRLIARYNASQKEFRVVSYFQGPYDDVMADDIKIRRGTRRSPHIVQVQDGATADMMRSGFPRPLWHPVQESRPKRPPRRHQNAE